MTADFDTGRAVAQKVAQVDDPRGSTRLRRGRAVRSTCARRGSRRRRPPATLSRWRPTPRSSAGDCRRSGANPRTCEVTQARLIRDCRAVTPDGEMHLVDATVTWSGPTGYAGGRTGRRERCSSAEASVSSVLAPAVGLEPTTKRSRQCDVLTLVGLRQERPLLVAQSHRPVGPDRLAV